jgi:8-oxo-dGTP pyrophosphatase MutT (NUDIX family)
MNNIPEFGLQRENEERRDGGCAVIFDPKTKLFAVGELRESGQYVFFGGGINEGEDIKECVLREVMEESGLHDFVHIEKLSEVITHYRNNVKKVNRKAHATCFLFILNSNNLHGQQLEEHEKIDLVWTKAENIKENWESRNENKDFDHWLYFLKLAQGKLNSMGYK